jgi:hypothetical protein
MAIRKFDIGDSGDADQDESAEAFWAYIDRQRSMNPPIKLPASMFEPLSTEAETQLRKAIAEHEEFMGWFAPYLAARRAAKGLTQADE